MKIYLWAKWVVFNGPYSCLRVSIKFQNQVSFVNLLLCTCTLSEWIFFILNCLVKLFKNNFHNLRIKFVVVCLWLNDCAFFQSQTAEEELAQASAAFQKQQEINTQHTQKVSVVFEKADSLKVIFSFSLIFFLVSESYIYIYKYAWNSFGYFHYAGEANSKKYCSRWEPVKCPC